MDGEITVAILAGGLGTRLRPVLGTLPKLLAPLAGRPFLDHLLHWVMPLAPQRILLCLGHGAEQVVDYVQRRPAPAVPLIPLVEPAPLGTAGALRHAAPYWLQGPLLVMNGDTWVDGDLRLFVAAHRAAAAEGSLLCIPMAECRRYGTVTLDPQGNIRHFVEKDPHHPGPGLVSSGILLLEPSLLALLRQSDGPSLERDFLATLAPGRLHGVVMDRPFIDFGIPESFAMAQTLLAPFASQLEEPLA